MSRQTTSHAPRPDEGDGFEDEASADPPPRGLPGGGSLAAGLALTLLLALFMLALAIAAGAVAAAGARLVSRWTGLASLEVLVAGLAVCAMGVFGWFVSQLSERVEHAASTLRTLGEELADDARATDMLRAAVEQLVVVGPARPRPKARANRRRREPEP